MKIIRLNNALSLPHEWDSLAKFYYQRQKFLYHCQNWNNCAQRYYLAYENNKLITGAVVYSLRLNLFTFSRFNIPLKIHILGIPCSVSSPGLIGSCLYTIKLFKYICSVETGLILALNIENTTGISNRFFKGKTLPVVKFKIPFSNWDDYLKQLRADYRRRLSLIKKKSSEIKFSSHSCNEFTLEMYDQYLQVYEQSSAKLERLEFNFFKYLPEEFNLLKATINNKLLGWIITLNSDHKLYFLFGGLDYSLNKEYAIYHRLLIEIIKKGIDSDVQEIDLGQTAEIAKLRLGGQLKELQMVASHHNPFINFILRCSRKVLEYKQKFPEHHVFRYAS